VKEHAGAAEGGGRLAARWLGAGEAVAAAAGDGGAGAGTTGFLHG
jgi:hypothetical protein